MDYATNFYTSNWSHVEPRQDWTDIYSQYAPNQYTVHWATVSSKAAWEGISTATARQTRFSFITTKLSRGAVPFIQGLFIICIWLLSVLLLRDWKYVEDRVCVISWKVSCALNEALQFLKTTVNTIIQVVAPVLEAAGNFVFATLQGWTRYLVSFLPTSISLRSPIKLTWGYTSKPQPVRCSCGTYKLLDYCLMPWDHEDEKPINTEDQALIAQLRSDRRGDQDFIDRLLSEHTQEEIRLANIVTRQKARLDHADGIEKRLPALQSELDQLRSVHQQQTKDLEQLQSDHKQQTKDLEQLREDHQQKTQDLETMEKRAVESEQALATSQDAVKNHSPWKHEERARSLQEGLRNAKRRGDELEDQVMKLKSIIEAFEASATADGHEIWELTSTINEWKSAADKASSLYRSVSREHHIKFTDLEAEYHSLLEGYVDLSENHHRLRDHCMHPTPDSVQSDKNLDDRVSRALEALVVVQDELVKTRSEHRASESRLKNEIHKLEWDLKQVKRTNELAAKELGDERVQDMEIRLGVEALELEA